jgi:replicative DNA helicase
MTALKTLADYGVPFQNQVIAALISNKEFLVNAYDTLDLENFSNPAHKWIIEEIKKYHNKYHTTPTVDFLKIEIKKIDNDVLKTSILEKLKEVFLEIDNNLEYVREEYLNFCRNQQLKNALLTSVDLLNIGDFDSIRKTIDNALKAGEEKNIGHEYKKDVESRYRKEELKLIPFPWSQFNNVTQGGYGPGDLILLFGTPGGGKSWTAIAMAAFAASLGYNVVYYSLELNEAYVGKRFDSFLTGIPVDELDNNRDKVEEVLSKLKGQIIIKSFPPKKATLMTIENHLNKVRSIQGIDINMGVIDYPDLLRNKKTRNSIIEDSDDIYTECKGLAVSQGIPIVAPCQVNRNGVRDQIIESDKIAGSFYKIMISDVSISLSRTRKDKVNKTGRYHFMKNRRGDDGMTYNAEIDLSCGKIEIGDEYDGDNEESTPSSFNQFSPEDKQTLKKKFFDMV